MSAGVHFVASARSDAGRVRANNQDAWSYSAEAGVFVVCDGIGGAAGGEIASQAAAEAFVEALAGLAAAQRTANAVAQAVCTANRRVLARAGHEPALRGMGTTLVGLVLGAHREEVGRSADDPGRGSAILAHVGDSRAYVWRAGVLTCCTKDHSLVAEQLRMGVLTSEEAERSPMRNVITRSVGSRRAVAPEIQPLALEPGDTVLLCTDGLTRELPDAAIAVLLQRGAMLPLSERNESLVEAALRAGGRDNVTSLLIEVR